MPPFFFSDLAETRYWKCSASSSCCSSSHLFQGCFSWFLLHAAARIEGLVDVVYMWLLDTGCWTLYCKLCFTMFDMLACSCLFVVGLIRKRKWILKALVEIWLGSSKRRCKLL